MINLDPPARPTPTGGQPSRLGQRIAVAGATVVLVAAIITAMTTGGIPILWHRIVDTPPAPPVAVATIRSPADVTVPHVVQLFGDYQNLPRDTVVWAVSQDMTTNTFFPQDKACSIDSGRFNCGTYYIGSDTGHGEKIKIVIVAATAEAVNGFSRYELNKGGPLSANPGMDALPVGSTVIGSAEVVHS